MSETGMVIKDVKVNWMTGYANDPYFQILVDEIPDIEEDIIYKVTPCRHDKADIYYGVRNGFVHFFADNADNRGHGGEVITVRKARKEDPIVIEEREIVGRWSSRAGVINRLHKETGRLGYVMEVAITDDPKAFERGHTFFAGAVTAEFAREVVDCINEWYGADIDLEWVIETNEEPVLKIVERTPTLSEAFDGYFK